MTDTAFAEAVSLKTLMLGALDAPDGKAAGTLAGPFAVKFQGMTGSQAPVRVEVTTLGGFQQAGCKRLNVHLVQANVSVKDAKPVEFATDYALNLCRDGNPPNAGMVRDVTASPPPAAAQR